MAAYNFQRRFAPMIVDLRKPHTIRPERKYPTVVGDLLQLYTGLRTKQCSLIAVSPCIDVQHIAIYPLFIGVEIDNSELSIESIDRLARRDGFQSRDEFFEFFMRYPVEVRENKLRLIWWSTKELQVITHFDELEVRNGR